MANTTIADLRAANPYRNQEYKESGWQKFLSALGFRTQADAWKENMSVQAAEYDAALAQKEFDTAYNDPQSQVARMRAAGLNPDLDPSMIDSGQSAPMGEDPSTPMQSTGDEETLMGIANTLLSSFTSAIGIFDTFQGMHKRRLENKLLGLQYDKEDLGITDFLGNFSKKYAIELLPESSEDVVYEDGSADSWQNIAFQKANIFSKNLPKKYRSAFMSNVQNFWNSAPTTAEAYKLWRERISQHKGYEVDKRTNYNFADEDLAIIADELARLYSRLEKQNLSTAVAKSETEEKSAEYEGQVVDNLNPKTSANAVNSSNESISESAKFQKEVNNSMNRIIRELKANKDPFSKLLLVYIVGNQMNLLPKTPSVSFSHKF